MFKQQTRENTMSYYSQSQGSAILKEEPKLFEPLFVQDNFVDLQSLQRTRVLLIEDDRTTRRMVARSVGSYCHLTEAFNSGMGISKYKNFDPDIVFLDLELPDDNGHNTLKWIMHNDPGAHVVLFSGSCNSHNVGKAMNNGAKGYVPKPFNASLMMYHICQCPKLH